MRRSKPKASINGSSSRTDRRPDHGPGKNAITAKAKKLGLSISELMRRGATAYQSETADDDLSMLADKAKDAADRAVEAIDDALAFVEGSNRRIAAMESRANAGKDL